MLSFYSEPKAEVVKAGLLESLASQYEAATSDSKIISIDLKELMIV
jgi:hypothetical protein